MIQYSEKEQRLFNELGFDELLKQEPAIAYTTLALYCFSTNITGPLVDSVSACYNALQEQSPKRLTEEFDNLIIINEFEADNKAQDDIAEKVEEELKECCALIAKCVGQETADFLWNTRRQSLADRALKVLDQSEDSPIIRRALERLQELGEHQQIERPLIINKQERDVLGRVLCYAWSAVRGYIVVGDENQKAANAVIEEARSILRFKDSEEMNNE
jgi:hypothetical protein